MNVVLAVARDARFWRCYTLTGARLVARMACDRAMRAGQFKFGIGRMIKKSNDPSHWAYDISHMRCPLALHDAYRRDKLRNS